VARKNYKLDILAPARNEIHEIARVHMSLVGSNSAKKITDKIKKSLEYLRANPLMGMFVDEMELRRLGYRKLISGNYLCFYRVISDTVLVYHIVDGRTDYPRIFNELKTQAQSPDV
jgi:plasmid stabilization system protein ParE